MPKCCIKGCSMKCSTNTARISLHKLPKREEVREKWLESLGRENIDYSLFVCSLHFEEHCFNRTLNIIRLRENAIPTQLPPVVREEKKSVSPAAMEVDVGTNFVQTRPGTSKAAVACPDSITVVRLKTKCSQQTLKIKRLNEKCRRLAKKLANIPHDLNQRKFTNNEANKTMVTNCCVKGCGNSSRNIKKKDPNSMISFHAFPSNQELKTKWLKAIGRPNWAPPNYSRVCSAHFNYDQINYDGRRIRIKDDAFPVNLLPLNSNFEASNVEACRVCLAIDVNMFSLQDTQLGTCMEAISGFSQNGMVEGLPQYVCYRCAPSLIKCNQLIGKCMISQATLLDIFAKNGQITKDLIKGQNGCQLEIKSSLDDRALLNHDDVNNTSPFTTADSIESEDDYFKNDADINIEADTLDLDDKESEVDTGDNEYLEVNDDVEEMEISTSVSNDGDKDSSSLNSRWSSNAQNEEDNASQMKKTLTGKKSDGLTPDEMSMLKYFDIVKLSLHEQLQEWKNRTFDRSLTSDNIHNYQCEICNKIFGTFNSYRVHVHYHEPSRGRAECPVCKLRFKTTALAATHVKRKHSKKFFCKICPKAFNNVVAAKSHHRVHSGYLYKCDKCEFSALHVGSLSVHKRRVHGTAHACALCGRSYNTRRGLSVHTHTAHIGAKIKDITKEYRCEQCDVNFASEGARRVHVLTSSQHKNKPDLCDTAIQLNLRNSCIECGEECASFKELASHMKAKHPRAQGVKYQWQGATPYPIDCEHCGETMTSRKEHWWHVRRQHPNNVDTYRPVITAICDTCGKGFQHPTKLRIHQLRHGSPTMRCHRCPRLFYDKYALARHAITHNGEKPHQCPTCGRMFNNLSNLRRHCMIHADVFPYECKICSKKFKYSTSVKLHERTVHYKLPYPTKKNRSKSTKDVSVSNKI